jgi:hypothetical protein
MKNPLVSLALLVLPLGLMASGNKPADEAAVRTAVEKFNAAAKAGDGKTLGPLLAEELVYGHSSAKMETKAECIAALEKGKPNFVMEPGWTVRIYGKTALVHGKMKAHNPTGIIPLDIMMMWVKKGAAWQMVARHTVRLPS